MEERCLRIWRCRKMFPSDSAAAADAVQPSFLLLLLLLLRPPSSVTASLQLKQPFASAPGFILPLAAIYADQC